MFTPPLPLKSILSSPPFRLNAMGLDIGYCNTKLTAGRDASNKIITKVFPSLAAPAPSANAQPVSLLGSMAKVARIRVKDGFYYVGPSVRDMMRAFSSGGGYVPDYAKTPEHYAFMLGAFATVVAETRAAERLEIEHLVMGLPVEHINDYGAYLVQLATDRPHEVPHPTEDRMVTVVVKHAYTVMQPEGALVARGLERGDDAEVGLVLDMGGGTFDYLPARGGDYLVSRLGSAPCGTIACAEAVCDRIKRGLKHDAHAVALVDKAIREGRESVEIAGKVHPIAQHMSAASDVVREGLRRMQRTVGSLNDISYILCTGGGALLVFRAFQEQFPDYPKERIFVDEAPLFSNVIGFHVLAEMQSMVHTR